MNMLMSDLLPKKMVVRKRVENLIAVRMNREGKKKMGRMVELEDD